MTTPMKAPDSGVTIRMYRQGHGDCFLLCFRRSDLQDDPLFVLIDIGKKSGSEVSAPGPRGGRSRPITMEEVIDDIVAATGGEIDVAVVTHEHEDHVSGLPAPEEADHRFRKLKIKRLWLAWTEDSEDDTANAIREAYNDQLLTLAAAGAEQKRLRADGEADGFLREMLELETGFADPGEFLRHAGGAGSPRQAFAAASRKPRGYRYKIRLAGLRRMVGEENIDFLDPAAGKPLALAEDSRLRAYPLGPPRDLALLNSLDPKTNEEFRLALFPVSAPGHGLFRAFAGDDGHAPFGDSPFAARFCIPEDEVLKARDDRYDPARHDYRDNPHRYFVNAYRYSDEDFTEAERAAIPRDIRDQLTYRQIADAWLGDAGAMALRLNSEVNNTSLVLLFELPNSGRTLLFTGDAQRGSWISWSDLGFGGRSVRDLLGDCVFYKVGHHGSHNATLKGTKESDFANLDWLATGDRAGEFTAMIPSNVTWAWGKARPWKHPLPAIEKALEKKARNRVMITSDLSMENAFPEPPADDPMRAVWEEFAARTRYTRLYIEHEVPDRGREPVGDRPGRC